MLDWLSVSRIMRPPSITVPVADLPHGIQSAAEYVLSTAEPYIYAAYLLSSGREEEALKQIQFCLSHPPIEDDHWAYNLWGVYFLERQKYDEAIEKFREATRCPKTLA